MMSEVGVARQSRTADAGPLIEGLGNHRATVYQFAGGSPSEPSVVFVVDRNADI